MYVGMKGRWRVEGGRSVFSLYDWLLIFVVLFLVITHRSCPPKAVCQGH